MLDLQLDRSWTQSFLDPEPTAVLGVLDDPWSAVKGAEAEGALGFLLGSEEDCPPSVGLNPCIIVIGGWPRFCPPAAADNIAVSRLVCRPDDDDPTAPSSVRSPTYPLPVAAELIACLLPELTRVLFLFASSLSDARLLLPVACFAAAAAAILPEGGIPEAADWLIPIADGDFVGRPLVAVAEEGTTGFADDNLAPDDADGLIAVAVPCLWPAPAPPPLAAEVGYV